MRVNDTLVVFDQVTKTFPTPNGPLTAVDELSFNINEGELLAVLGPSGCGKSTLMLMMAGLSSLSSGSVRISDRTITEPYTDLGIVFQGAELLSWRTAVDNVLLQADIRRLPKRAATERAHALLAAVGLEGFEGAYPHELSGGMRQRVALCRALLHDPAILAMDEPFGALDALTREQLQLDLLRLRAETHKTVLFITHSIEEAVFLADRVLVLSQRPARIATELTVPFPSPRDMSIRSDPEFTRYVGAIRDTFTELGVFDDSTGGQRWP